MSSLRLIAHFAWPAFSLYTVSYSGRCRYGSDDMPFVQVVLANRSFLGRIFRFHVFQFTSTSGRGSAAASSSRAAHFEQPRVWKLFKLRPGATIRLGGS